MTASQTPTHLLHKALYAVLVLVILGLIGASLLQQLRPVTPLPVFSTVPSFNLTNQDGQPVTNATLGDKPWIADFIFTSCPAACPLMTKSMKGLQDSLRDVDAVRFVSISVDPEVDQPAILKAYGDVYGATPGKWIFLTGSSDQIFELANKGFLFGFFENKKEDREKIGRFSHSTKFALVDRQGRVRAYYEHLDPELAAKIRADLARLAKETP
jgi:protein SCO1/2